MNISALTARASSGDAAAQYALAATYSRARNREEADRWLRAAADSGHPDALYTLATRQLSSESAASEAASLLAEAADRGSSAAVRLLAVLTATGVGIARDENGAIDSVLELARGGNKSARREIACLLAISDPHHEQIASLLQSDETNDPVAAAFRIAREVAGRAAGDRSELESARLLLERLRYPRAQSLASALNSRVTPGSDSRAARLARDRRFDFLGAAHCGCASASLRRARRGRLSRGDCAGGLRIPDCARCGATWTLSRLRPGRSRHDARSASDVTDRQPWPHRS